MRNKNISASAETKTPVTVDGRGEIVSPTSSSRLPLKTIDDVRVECARVYREMRSGLIDTSDGSKLVYVLGQISKMIELYDIENRIKLLEIKNGNN